MAPIAGKKLLHTIWRASEISAAKLGKCQTKFSKLQPIVTIYVICLYTPSQVLTRAKDTILANLSVILLSNSHISLPIILTYFIYYRIAGFLCRVLSFAFFTRQNNLVKINSNWMNVHVCTKEKLLHCLVF